MACACEVIVSVRHQRTPKGEQGIVRRSHHPGQQFHKFVVGRVHLGQTKRQRAGPLQRGHHFILSKHNNISLRVRSLCAANVL